MVSHKYDSTGSCIYCGFKSAEWFVWRYNTFAGMRTKAVYPECKQRAEARETWRYIGKALA